MAKFLPDLPLIEIFQHLGLVDLTRARAVSRRWKALIDCCVKIEELVVCPDAISKPMNWFHLNKAIDPNEVLKLDATGSDFSKFNQKIVRLQLLSSLKRLSVAQDSYKKIVGCQVDRLFSSLVKFTALEHLEISLDFEYCDEWSCTLVHPNLKVLSLGHLNDCPDLHVEIDCPRLEFLQCFAPFDQFTVTFPETIKQLYYYRFGNYYSDRTASSSDLEAFANLEFYVCNLFALEDVNFWSLPKLKELRVENYYWDVEYVPVARFVLTELIARKKRLESARVSPKIYLDDIECSANLKESHPFLFPVDEDWTDDADSSMDAE